MKGKKQNPTVAPALYSGRGDDCDTGNSATRMGIGVCSGIGIAQAMVWRPISAQHLPHRSEHTEVEMARFDHAHKTLVEKTKELRDRIALHRNSDEAAILDAYSLMLLDESDLLEPLREKISVLGYTAEYAIDTQLTELAGRFTAMEDEYLRQRTDDIYSLRDLLIRELQGLPRPDTAHLARPTIVVAQALSPADIAALDMSRLEGIVCEAGGYTSHVAIICRTLGIPAILAAKGALDTIKDGIFLGMDGETGDVWLEPQKKDIDFLRKKQGEVEKQRNEDMLFRGRPSITSDGHRVELAANIGQLEEVEAALAADAEALGLFRTELLYVNAHYHPSEEDQLLHFCSLLDRLKGKAATVRTFDDGGNRTPLAVKGQPEGNPAMGYRGIRMSLGRPSVFRTQLRALLRASAYGPIKVMFPMVSGLDELEDALAALESVKKELRRDNIPFDEGMPVGVEIEVPSAALLADAIAQRVDFLCVGLNELVQFTLAADRTSPALAHLCKPYHPAVLRLVNSSVLAAHRYGKPCYISGDDPNLDCALPLLLGLEPDGFSLNPWDILSFRRILNSCNYAECRRLAEEVLLLDCMSDVEKRLDQWLEEQTKEYIPNRNGT